MYYPIIDKLKEVMADIKSVKEKEPLVIVGTFTSKTSGTWTGNYSDIGNAFSNNRQVLVKLVVQDDIIIIPVYYYNAEYSTSGVFPFNDGKDVKNTYGIVYPSNRFYLNIIQ